MLPTPGNLKKLRIDAKLTQNQAGALVDRKWRMWQRYETGVSPIPQIIWELFLIKLKINVDSLQK